MKKKIWFLQTPIIAVCTFAFWVTDAGVRGELNSSSFREDLFPHFRRLSGMMTDWKLHVRGEQKSKNKIVIVGIDNDSVSALGRWPWHRDQTVDVIRSALSLGAKVVGLDIVFAEPDIRVSRNLRTLLSRHVAPEAIQDLETDRLLSSFVRENSDRIVLGWTYNGICQPAYHKPGECQAVSPTEQEIESEADTDYKEILSQSRANWLAFEKHRLQNIQLPSGFDPSRLSLFSVNSLGITPNLSDFSVFAKYSGSFGVESDPDGIIRRTLAVVRVDNSYYPTLALAVAQSGLRDEAELIINPAHKVQSLKLSKSGQSLPISPVGAVEMNFRGKNPYPILSALDVLSAAKERSDEALNTETRQPASESTDTENENTNFYHEIAEQMKDAFVFIGVTASGANDLRNFPFASHAPGVEGHATILDNILSNDFLSEGPFRAAPIIYLLMIVGGIAFAIAVQKFEAVPALLLAVTSIGGLGFFDFGLLFHQDINWNFSFLYVELIAMLFFTLAVKYVLEERHKKFIRGAFAKYVAPAIVDSIIKDPSKLHVGGERRDLTILFSDIRGFTTFSEKMDPKKLTKFLNEYLGVMTDLVFSNQGTLDKYIGDAVMAFWGAPIEQKPHAANACKAAVLMLQALDQHRPRFKAEYDVDVNIGIGINTGTVNVGNMGSEKIFEYTVIGDHVNLASRLESLTKYYAVTLLTTRFTMDAIEATGDTKPAHRTLDFAKVKGKKIAVELIQIFDREMSSEGLQKFDEGRRMYRERAWDAAIGAFNQANQLLTSERGPDGPSLMYVKRCEEMKLNPPAPEWDGTWEMHEK